LIPELAIEIAHQSSNHLLADGKSPKGVAAGYIYFAAMSHRLQRQVSELREEGDQIQKLRQEKDDGIHATKLKYEEMRSTLQNILTVISNLEHPVDKNRIAQVSW